MNEAKTGKRTEKAMHLKVLLPTEVLVDEPVVHLVAEAENGSFCLLPRHIDFVAALVPGVLEFRDASGAEQFAALDEGTLVKCGRDVLVSSWKGVRGTDLARLRDIVDETFLELDEHERKARGALARLEAGTLRGFRELQERFRG